jgi:hypothetical protein
MKEIILKHKTQNTPFVHFNAQEGIFELIGRLTVEDDKSLFDFVMPLINYLDEYRKNIQVVSIFLFHIEYLDAISNIFFYDIIRKIYDIRNLTNLRIVWYFTDEEEEELGYNIQEYFVDMPFKFINLCAFN